MSNLDHISRTYPTSIMLHFKIFSCGLFEKRSGFSCDWHSLHGHINLAGCRKASISCSGRWRALTGQSSCNDTFPSCGKSRRALPLRMPLCLHIHPITILYIYTLISPVSVGRKCRGPLYLCVQWKLGWPTIILNLGLWDFRVLCPLFETMSQCIQWVCYPIHILLLQYGSLNRCVVSIYYYVKVRWQSLCHNNRWYQCTFCTQNCISCAIHQKQLSYMYNFV